MLHLKLKVALSLPLDLEGIVPSKVSSLSLLEVAKLPVLHGNRTMQLGEFFDVRGDCSYGEMHFLGDCSQLRHVAERLDSGRIIVEGNVGFHAGARMTGGELVIRGHAGDWLGAEMHGGRIRVIGSAGNHVGGAYVGSKFGQRGGEIFITGNAGDELGVRMRRGLIAVSGHVGRFAGLAMIAGTILAVQGLGPAAGAGMKRGTLISFAEPDIAPGFAHSCTYRPAYLGLLLHQLREAHFEPAEHLDIPLVNCYRGDRLAGGRGELLIAQK